MHAMTARHDVRLPSLLRSEKPGGPMNVLRRDFGLTAAEARVAVALADGMGVPEICASQSIATTTVRSHLKSIYRKTNTQGQVQLVVLVFKLLRLG